MLGTVGKTAEDRKPAVAKRAKAVDKRVAALRRFAISISVFTIVGHIWLGFETSWASVVVVLSVAYSTELALEYLEARLNRRSPRFAGGIGRLVTFLLPSHIGALAIAMLIYPGGELWPFAFAVCVATCAKYIVQAPVTGRMRHVFNPSNLGISATLFAFPWVGIGLPYQFTADVTTWLDWAIPIGVFASGLLLNWKLTGKLPLILSWMGFFALQACLRGLSPDVSMLGAFAPMTGLAFLLFTTYMITDPGTTPVRPRNQVIFGAACAAAYAFFMLTNIVYAIFYSLVVVCAVRGAYLWAVELMKRVRTPATPTAMAGN